MKKIILLNYVLLSFLIIGILPNISAQQHNQNWYFGNQAGINFNDGTSPSTLSADGAMNAPAGSASVSNELGQLLFYTNGETVWNGNHTIMSNGHLIGDAEVSQSAVIVPKPDDSGKYYIFSNSANNPAHPGFRYSVVDMSLDGGLGDIDTVEKDVLLLTTCSEKMTTVINPFENSYWLVVFGPSNDLTRYDTFYTYKIDPVQGIQVAVVSNFTPPPAPVDPFNPGPGEFDRNNPEHLAMSAISTPFQATNYSYAPYSGGQMKISPDFISLALVHNVNDRGQNSDAVFTFSFNPTNGLVTSISSHYLSFLFNYSNTYYYGAEFSPDSQQLFVSTFEKDQNGFGAVIRIRNFIPDEIPTTYDVMNISGTRDPVFSLQLGIDGLIYVSRGDLSYMDIITNPNESDIDLFNYSYGGVIGGGFDLGSKIGGQGLPQLVPEVFLNFTLKYLPKKPVLQANPFKEELKLKFKFIQTYTIQAYNSNGALYKSTEYKALNRQIYKYDTSNWPQDTYYLVISDELGQTWYKTAIKVL